MMNSLIELILKSAEGAFLQVGVFVGIALLIFGYLNYRQGGKIVEYIEKKKRLQPLIGALLGLTPGCGGAIIIMPLFLKKTVSFGTVVATLVATMGDSAFVLMTKMPVVYIWVSVISFLVALATGYIVDNFGIGKDILKHREILNPKELSLKHEEYELVPTEYEMGLAYEKNRGDNGRHIGHEEGDYVDLMLHHSSRERNPIWHKFIHTAGYKIFWIVALAGLVLGVLLLAQVDINTSLGIKNIGVIVGTAGTAISVIYTLVAKKILKDDTHEEVESKMMSLKEMFIHNAQETAFVTSWVFVAFLLYEIGIFALGGEAVLMSWLSVTGLLTVIIGALLGLIPGCGPQIMFVALFTKGAIPFAALIANAISQDGDALFPLLAMDKKSSLLATVVTTVPALIIGLIFYFA